MKGRWTVKLAHNVCAWGDTMAVVSDPVPTEDPTPVVPCDDAAVERIARWLHCERFGCAGEEPCATCRRDAEAVLRAAGESP
jgi:hypothetical protein